MKKNTYISLIITLLVIIMLAFIYLFSLTPCDYDSATKQYINRNTEECKTIHISCAENREPFFDKCGCGCKLTTEKNFCTEQQRKAEVCPVIYQPVCGYFNTEKVNCIKSCFQTFPNSCLACADENVEYWILGEC